jgi:threonine-phosphate decarboxylase
LLFYTPTPLIEPLRRRGILLRDCANYHGLGQGWYRAAVRGEGDNRRFIAALEEITKEEHP